MARLEELEGAKVALDSVIFIYAIAFYLPTIETLTVTEFSVIMLIGRKLS